MTAMDYIKKCLTSHYANFEGRARRSEYWYFVLFNIIISIITNIFTLNNSMVGSIISLIVSLGLFLPGLSAAVRRLHDTGRSGWWYLLVFTIIGIIPLIYWLCLDSHPGDNEFGSNPKSGVVENKILDDLV